MYQHLWFEILLVFFGTLMWSTLSFTWTEMCYVNKIHFPYNEATINLHYRLFCWSFADLKVTFSKVKTPNYSDYSDRWQRKAANAGFFSQLLLEKLLKQLFFGRSTDQLIDYSFQICLIWNTFLTVHRPWQLWCSTQYQYNGVRSETDTKWGS